MLFCQWNKQPITSKTIANKSAKGKNKKSLFVVLKQENVTFYENYLNENEGITENDDHNILLGDFDIKDE